jgi:hypothetical protein
MKDITDITDITVDLYIKQGVLEYGFGRMRRVTGCPRSARTVPSAFFYDIN